MTPFLCNYLDGDRLRSLYDQFRTDSVTSHLTPPSRLTKSICYVGATSSARPKEG
jgi:hypothetical protein